MLRELRHFNNQENMLRNIRINTPAKIVSNDDRVLRKMCEKDKIKSLCKYFAVRCNIGPKDQKR